MALVNSYDAVIFDYGGVLVEHQTQRDQARLAAIARIDPERFSELYWSDRMEYDRGSTTALEYWAAIAQQSGVALPESVFEELTEVDTESWMRFDPVMWQWVEQLKAAGKRLAMLSNMPFDLGHALKSKTNRLSHFDQVTLSYEVRSVKPEAAIYDHCLEGLGSTPDRTLFLDDRIENIHGAEMLGIRAIQFIDRDDVLLQLRA